MTSPLNKTSAPGTNLTALPISMAPFLPLLRHGLTGPLLKVTSLPPGQLDSLLGRILTGENSRRLGAVTGGQIGLRPAGELTDIARLLSTPTRPSDARTELNRHIYSVPSPIGKVPELGRLNALLCSLTFPADDPVTLGLHLNITGLNRPIKEPARLIFSGWADGHASLLLTWPHPGQEEPGEIQGEVLKFQTLDEQLNWHVKQLPGDWNRSGIRVSMQRVAEGTLDITPLLAPPVSLP